MTSFDNKYKALLEGFGGPLTTRMYAPRIKLSEKFTRAFREEYSRLCRPEQILDENDNFVEEKPKNKKTVMKQLQKALPFLTR
jgi:hypothetical protein